MNEKSSMSAITRFFIIISLLIYRSGNLVGATTAKDLGLFIKNLTLQALQGNIFDYLKAIRQEQVNVCLFLGLQLDCANISR